MSETKNLKLFKHNEPLETNENKFDIDLALNQNWDKIDGFAEKVNNKVIELEDKNTEQDFNLQEQNTKLEEKIKKDRENMINLEVEGQSIHIEDSSDLEGQLEVLGNVEQDVREGYNLFNVKNISNKFITDNGVEQANENWVLSDFIEVEELTDYLLGWTSISPVFQARIILYNKDKSFMQVLNFFYENMYKKTFRTIQNCKYIRISYATSVRGQKAERENVQLVKGTAEKPYEQYGASPSPEHPSEIRVVGDKGSVGINKTSANYYNVQNYIGSQRPLVDKDDWITLTGSNTETSTKYLNYFTENLDLNIGKNYWIVAEIKSVSGKGNFYVTSRLDDVGQGQFYGNVVQIADLKKGDKVIFQKTAMNSKGHGLRTFISLSQGESVNITFRISVLENDPNKSNWKYVPYKKQTYILPIQKPMLEGDYFVKEIDGWKEVHKWEKKVFNGTENFGNVEDTGSVKYFPSREKLDLYKYSNDNTANYISNCFKNITVSQRYINNTFFINSGKIPVFSSNSFTTTEEFKSKLLELYNKNNPMYIYYELAIPTKLPCTPEQTKILDELDNFQTYKPVTNITTDSIAKLRLKYIADTKTYVDNKYNGLAQQILNLAGGNNNV